MAALTWGNPGERLFEVGVDRGVLFPRTGPGVAWSGLIAVTESPSGGDSKPFYMDGVKYQDRGMREEFTGTIEAYTYPREFARCDGSESLAEGLFATQQYRQAFGMSYRTKIGNDLNGVNHGYKIHIVYNAKVQPSERANASLSDSPDAITFSWGFSTIPAKIPGVRPTAHLVIDSTLTDPLALATIEEILYGSTESVSRLPTPTELIDIYFEAEPELPFVVGTPDSNGMFTISGSNSAVSILDGNHFQLNTEFVTNNGDGSYTATSE